MTVAVTKSTLAEYLRIVFQRKWLILAVTVLTVGFTIVYAYCLATELYRYEQTVYIRLKPVAVDLSKAAPLPKRLNDLLEVLKRPENAKTKLLEKANKRVIQAGYEPLKEPRLTTELKMLPTRLKVTNFREHHFVVRYDCSNPYVAKEVVRIVIDYLKTGTKEAVEKAVTEAEEVFTKALERYKPRVESAYQALKGVTPKDIEDIYFSVPGTNTNAGSLEATAQYFALFKLKYEIGVELKGLDEKIARLKELLAKKVEKPIVQVTYKTTPEYRETRAALDQVKTRLAVARQTKTDLHPEVRRLLSEKQLLEARLSVIKKEEKIEETLPAAPSKARLALIEELNEAEAERAALAAKVKHLTAVLRQQRDILKKVGEHHLNRIKATQKYQTARAYLEKFESELESLKLTQLVEIYEQAIILEESKFAPESAVLIKPKRKLLILLGVLVAAFMSGAMIFAAEYADHSLNTVNDMRQVLPGVMVMGQVSHFRTQGRELFRKKHKYIALEGRFLGVRLRTWMFFLLVAALIAGAYLLYRSKNFSPKNTDSGAKAAPARIQQEPGASGVRETAPTETQIKPAGAGTVKPQSRPAGG